MVQNAAQQYPNDGIDIRDLLQTLWASRVLIILITVIFTAVAAIYAFVSTPVFQTSVHLLPPTTSGLASYNIASQLTGEPILGTVADSTEGIAPLTTDNAYKIFLRHLNSNTVRQRFFEEYYLPAQPSGSSNRGVQNAWLHLNKELKITLPKVPNTIDASVTLEGPEPTTIADWANSYVALAIAATREELIGALTGEITIREQSLQRQISALREIGEKERKDRIARLEGALTIAESIGLEEPADATPLVSINTHRHSKGLEGSGILYLRGAKALRAELSLLSERTSEDAYIPEIPDLLKKLALLKGIDLSPDLLSVVTIDRPADIPEDPIKPRKGLIIVLGFILGLILAPFFVLLKAILSKSSVNNS